MIKELINKNPYFSKFLVVGSINTLVDIIFFFIFANLLLINPIVSNIFSTSIAMCLSFYLNHYMVFQSNKKKSQTVLSFMIITIFNVWVIQSLVIYLTINIMKNLSYLQAHHWSINLLAKLSGICVSFLLNFVMYKRIFHNSKQEISPIL